MLLGALAWWSLSRGLFTAPIHMEERVESRLTAALLKEGLRDADILSTVREERSEGGRRWVQTTRALNVPASLSLRALREHLTGAVAEPGLEASASPAGAGDRTLDFSWRGLRLERLILRQAPAAAAGRRRKVAIVIDDVVGNTGTLENFYSLDIPLTFSVLPAGKNSRTFSRLLSEKKGRYEYILHLPLEPHRAWPDKAHALLRVAMTPAEKTAMLDKYLNEVPSADGVSNHMGSAFTEDRPSMEVILKDIKARNIFFFDSHTSLKTVAYATAKEMGIPTALNRVFLDNQDDAAAIGHYHRKHLVEAIARAIPEFKKRGIEFVRLKDVLEPPQP